VTKECIEWVKRAIQSIKFGEVNVIIHNGDVVKVETKERKLVK
jgi:hypothetical protein